MLSQQDMLKWQWDLQRFGFTPRKILSRAGRKPSSLKPVFMVAIPKSGTHLLERVLCLHPLIYRPLVRTLNPSNIERLGGWLRYVDPLRPGQLLVTHARYDPTLSSLLQDKEMGVLLQIRDPRAMALSQAHYVRSNRKHWLHDATRHLSLSACIDLCINEPVMAGGITYIEAMKCVSMWASQPFVLTTRFEQLVGTDLETRAVTISRILQHVGIIADAETCLQISRAAISKVSPTFRSGNIREWDGVLSATQRSKIEDGLRGTIFDAYMAERP